MTNIDSPSNARFNENLVKNALANLDWNILKRHFDEIGPTEVQFMEVCNHARRCTQLICKYPNKKNETGRAHFFDEFRAYANARSCIDAVKEITSVETLLGLVEHGYRSIHDVLDNCPISTHPPVVRVAAAISRAGHQYLDLLSRRDAALAASRELNLLSGLRLQDDDGNTFSPDAVLDLLAETVAMTIIMEAYKNKWFESGSGIVVLTDLPDIGEKERYEAGATEVLAAFWRQWERAEKRRRYLGGDLRRLTGPERPGYFPPQIETVIEYRPPEDGLSKCEVYDEIAHRRLKDRLVQTFFEMEVEHRISDKAVGISQGAALPPSQYISAKEFHAIVSLSEILGYSIVNDIERPGGLRLLEWVRGYAVLQKLAQTRSDKTDTSVADYTLILTESELVGQLKACGLKEDAATRFIAQTCLHKSSRDLFDCPLVRLRDSRYLLFGPAAIHMNIALVVLSNLSNRGEKLGRKGKAFENSMREFFCKQGLDVFTFEVRRDESPYEYDALVPWEEYLFLFECKNRSLPINDSVQSYYFDLETASEIGQVLRLAKALERYPDIIMEKMGPQYLGRKIIPCVLHSLPYSRIGKTDGVYFTDASALKRFFEQPYLHIKVPHSIGPATVLHRTAIKKFWAGERPIPTDLIEQLEHPFQVEILRKHLEVQPFDFGLSDTELAITYELVHKEMDMRSICEAFGVSHEVVLEKMETVADVAEEMRSKFGRSRQPGNAPIEE